MESATDSKWLRVTRSEPCPICGKPDYCTVSADGMAARCMRIESEKESVGRDGSTAWVHRLNEPVPVPLQRKKAPPKSKPEIKHLAQTAFQNGAEARKELSRVLNVSVESLEALRVGWREDRIGPHWTFPARDFWGETIGVVRRYRDGKKLSVRGSRNGLFYCDDWWKHNRVYVVEGASDTAALITCGKGAIGRPSNTGGMELLVPLLKRMGVREVTVFGECDFKRQDELSELIRERHDPACRGCNACWPGKYGAVRVSEQLERCGIRAFVRYPKAKDVRESVELYGCQWI